MRRTPRLILNHRPWPPRGVADRRRPNRELPAARPPLASSSINAAPYLAAPRQGRRKLAAKCHNLSVI